MTRSRRRLIAWLGILGIAFAQLAVTAHACMARTPMLQQQAQAEPTPAPHGPCAGRTGTTPSPAQHDNACEVQCSDGAPPATAPGVPFVALASLSGGLAPAAAFVDAREWRRSTLAANSNAPPLPLQFCRLLI